MDLNHGAWHMGLAMDDPAVADLADGWGEIVSLGSGGHGDDVTRDFATPARCNHHPEATGDCEADNQRISWEEGA